MLVAQIALLWASGAFHGEFGEYPDEPSHFITGLMVRDYVLSGAPAPPMKYAENYYLHYPKIALGHYPPFLYVVEAAWMTVLPISRQSALLLNAVLTAISATLLGLFIRNSYGLWAGLGAGLLLVALPLTQYVSGMVMAEPLSTCLALGALLFFGRYLEEERWADSAWFGVLAGLAILTKQVALFLALVPPIAVLLSGKLYLLKRFSFWLSAVVTMALAAPWYVYAARTFVVKISSLAALAYARPTLEEQLRLVPQAVGYVLTALMIAGIWTLIVRPLVARSRPQGTWALFAAAVVAFFLFRQAVPSAMEPRHLANVQPALVAFMVGGIVWLQEELSRFRGRRGTWAAAIAAAAGCAFLLESFRFPPRRYHGFEEAASELAANADLRDETFLVCSDAGGEGAFIAQVAARDQRPGHIILRGSKMLADISWGGANYSLRFTTPLDIMKFMESVPVRILILESSGPRSGQAHERLVDEMIRQYPERWSLIRSYPNLRPASPPGVGVHAYRLLTREGQSRSRVRIELQRHLGRAIEN
jgi:hypothetical protein